MSELLHSLMLRNHSIVDMKKVEMEETVNCDLSETSFNHSQNRTNTETIPFLDLEKPRFTECCAYFAQCSF